MSILENVDVQLFEQAKLCANGNIAESFRLANEIISKKNENCCFGVFIILKIKKTQNILVETDVDDFIKTLCDCQKITESESSKICIKIINKFLLSQERPKTKTIKLLSYDRAIKKILRVEMPWNFSFVDDSLAGSAIVKKEDLQLLSDLGFTTVVSLLETNYSKEFTDTCKHLNISSHNFNVDDRTPPTFEQLDQILEIIFSNTRTIVHCLGGIGRTNVILVAFLIKKLNISPSEAITLLEKNRKVILTTPQLMFVKKYYGICNTPKYAIKTTVKLPGLIMMIGCPCSGKTTFCMELMTYYPDIVHISQDELGRKECESLFSSKAKNSTIILDRCNVSKEERKEWLTSYTQLTNKKIWAIYFNLDVNVCKERVKFRENHPTLSGPGAQRIIEDVYSRVEAPIANENFSEIIMVTDDNSLVRAKNKFGFGFKINYNLITKFPRTKHITNLGSMSRDDLMYTAKDLADFLSMDLTVEEKIDGANLGIFYDCDTYKIKAQNRSHFVDSSYHAQFKLLDKWILNHTPQLMKIFDKGDYIIYGEWVYLKHSINYVKLPDYFIAYDIYDRVHDIFLKRSESELLLKDSTIAMVPIIYTGKATLDKLKSLVQTKSQYYYGPIEGIYVRAFENDIVKYRGKIVRSNFICGDVDGNVNHWTKGIHTINELAN